MNEKVILDEGILTRYYKPIFSVKDENLHITDEGNFSRFTNIIENDKNFLDMVNDGAEVFIYSVWLLEAKKLVAMRKRNKQKIDLVEGYDYIIVKGQTDGLFSDKKVSMHYIAFRKGIFYESDFWVAVGRPNSFSPSASFKFYFNV